MKQTVRNSNPLIGLGAVIALTVIGCSDGADSGWQTVPVGSQWIIDIPASAEPVPSNPQGMFVMKDRGMLVMLDAMTTETSCPAFLEETEQQTLEALKDPVQQQLMQMHIEMSTVDGKQALTTEGGSRSPDEVRQGTPMHPIGMQTICVDDKTAVQVSLSLREGPYTEENRSLLRKIVASLRSKS